MHWYMLFYIFDLGKYLLQLHSRKFSVQTRNHCLKSSKLISIIFFIANKPYTWTYLYLFTHFAMFCHDAIKCHPWRTHSLSKYDVSSSSSRSGTNSAFCLSNPSQSMPSKNTWSFTSNAPPAPIRLRGLCSSSCVMRSWASSRTCQSSSSGHCTSSVGR